MRYLSLNFGDQNCASSFYRIHSYQRGLRSLGIELVCTEANHFSDWHSLKSFDGVIIQKKLFSLGKIQLIRARAKRLIFDIDDAIWLPHKAPHHWFTKFRTELRLKRTVRCADLTLAANEQLASHLRAWSEKVVVFPMALDETIWKPIDPAPHSPIRIGWSGSPSNLPYLEALDPVFQQLQALEARPKLVVLCGKRPNLSIPYDFIEWRPGIEPSCVASFDIGLLPLPENHPFASYKSPIKGLQYLACGVPVIATQTAATSEMFEANEHSLFARNHTEWFNLITRLLLDSAFRKSQSQKARKLFLNSYSINQKIQVFAKKLQGLYFTL